MGNKKSSLNISDEVDPVQYHRNDVWDLDNDPRIKYVYEVDNDKEECIKIFSRIRDYEKAVFKEQPPVKVFIVGEKEFDDIKSNCNIHILHKYTKSDKINNDGCRWEITDYSTNDNKTK